MRSLFILAIASLFMAGDFFVSAETNTMLESQDTQFQELHYVDMDVQSRRKDWDIFGMMLMSTLRNWMLCFFLFSSFFDAVCSHNVSFLLLAVINNQCGPGGRVGPLECPALMRCENESNPDCSACNDLCKKKDSPRPGHHDYSVFCNVCDSSGNAVASSSSQVDSYNGNSTPGSFVGSGSYSTAFSAWMVAVAISVGMALVAVHIGQRREDVVGEDRSLLGAEVRGSVGRRAAVVSGLMDGVLGNRNDSKQVELSEYQLEPARTSSYESAIV